MVKGKNGKRNHRRERIRLGYLNCEIEEGMFGTEKIVSVRVADEDISIIVSSENLNGGKLQVEVIGRKGSQYLVDLPGESFSTAKKVWVPQNSLVLSR